MSLSLDSFVKTHELLRATDKVATFTTSTLKGISGVNMQESLRTIGSIKLFEGVAIGSVATGALALAVVKVKEYRALKRLSELLRDKHLTLEGSFAEIVAPDSANVSSREE